MTSAQLDVLFRIVTYVLILSATAVCLGVAFAVVVYFARGAFDDDEDSDPVVSAHDAASVDAPVRAPTVVPFVRQLPSGDQWVGPLGPHPPYGRRRGDWSGPTH